MAAPPAFQQAGAIIPSVDQKRGKGRENLDWFRACFNEVEP